MPKETENDSLGGRLRALRERLGLSQEKAARAAGIERPNLSALEHGKLKFTSTDTQRGLAQAFSVRMGDLVAYAHGELELDVLLARRTDYKLPPDGIFHVRERTVERPTRYNNLVVALKRMAEAGEVVPPEAAAEVEENVRLLSEEDPPVATWTTFVRDHVRRRKALQDATQAEIRKALGGVAVQEDDVAKPKVRQRS